MKLVLVESPLAAPTPELVERNKKYAKALMRYCLKRGWAPYASHLLYAQEDLLDDTIPAERELGIEAGLAWGRKAELTVVGTDLGISGGMQRGINRAQHEGRPIETVELGPHWEGDWLGPDWAED